MQLEKSSSNTIIRSWSLVKSAKLFLKNLNLLNLAALLYFISSPASIPHLV